MFILFCNKTKLSWTSSDSSLQMKMNHVPETGLLPWWIDKCPQITSSNSLTLVVKGRFSGIPESIHGPSVCEYTLSLQVFATQTLPGLWNFPVKRPLFFKSNGLSTFLMPNMLERTISWKVQGFWLFCTISASSFFMASRVSLLIT